MTSAEQTAGISCYCVTHQILLQICTRHYGTWLLLDLSNACAVGVWTLTAQNDDQQAKSS